MTCERIGALTGSSLEEFRAWAQSVPLSITVRSSYAPERLEAWFRRGLHLGKAQLSQHPDPPARVVALADRLLPGWHSALLCGADTTIKPHRDASGFGQIAVLINLGESKFTYWPKQNVTTEPVHVHMRDGEVFRLNVKTLHAAEPLTSGRMSFTLRTITREVLAQEQPSLEEQLGLVSARQDIALSCGVPVSCVPENHASMDEHELTIAIESRLEIYSRLTSSVLYRLVEK